MNKVTAESRERDSAVILFGPGDYCALTKKTNLVEVKLRLTLYCIDIR